MDELSRHDSSIEIPTKFVRQEEIARDLSQKILLCANGASYSGSDGVDG